MRILLVAPIILAGCMTDGGGLGNPGSPAWFATTPHDQIIAHYRQNCIAYGYTGSQLPACIQQEMSQGRDGARSRMQTLANKSRPKPMTHTNCYSLGRSVNCTTY